MIINNSIFSQDGIEFADNNVIISIIIIEEDVSSYKILLVATRKVKIGSITKDINQFFNLMKYQLEKTPHTYITTSLSDCLIRAKRMIHKCLRIRESNLNVYLKMNITGPAAITKLFVKLPDSFIDNSGIAFVTTMNDWSQILQINGHKIITF